MVMVMIDESSDERACIFVTIDEVDDEGRKSANSCGGVFSTVQVQQFLITRTTGNPNSPPLVRSASLIADDQDPESIVLG